MLNWTLGGLRFAPEGKGAAYSAIHLFICGVRGLLGIGLGTFCYRQLYQEGDPYFFPVAFSIIGTLTLGSVLWLFVLERMHGHRFKGKIASVSTA